VGEATQSGQESAKVVKSAAEWRKLLTAEQFEITRQKGTEPAYQNKYWNHKQDGIYTCACCGHRLFDSKTKFDSGTGWPSYYQPLTKNAVTEVADYSYGMVRVEVVCSRCDAHLGHVFDDGPQPTGLRYCMNSGAMNFQARGEATESGQPEKQGAASAEQLSAAVKKAMLEKSKEQFLNCSCWDRLAPTTRDMLRKSTPAFMNRDVESIELAPSDAGAPQVPEGFEYNVAFRGHLEVKFKGDENVIRMPYGEFEDRFYLASLVKVGRFPSDSKRAQTPDRH
jgi:peptide-methionine (R)-S-oxide reductase